MAFDTWNELTTSALNVGRKGPRAVSHKGMIIVTAGSDGLPSTYKHNDVWKSIDGTMWEMIVSGGIDAPWVGRSVHGMVSDGTDLYLFGGSTSAYSYLNDFWRSQDDGETWELLNSGCDWPSRHEFGYAYMNGRIYVYGGYNGQRLNDCWSISTSSDDALSGAWTEEMSDSAFGYGSPTQWTSRREMAYCVHEDKIWCLGGDSNGGYENDVWYSSDGATWTSATSAAEWSTRREHAAFSFDGKLWIAAGGPTAKNDTWYTSAATTDEPWIEFIPTIDYDARLDAAILFHNNGVYIISGED